MSLLIQDQIFEAKDARPLIETWTLRYATVLSICLIVVSCLSLFAAMKANARSIKTFAVNEKGYAFELPFYPSAVEAKAAAIVIDSAAGTPTPKLMSHVRSAR